jgi:hypothetical protein
LSKDVIIKIKKSHYEKLIDKQEPLPKNRLVTKCWVENYKEVEKGRKRERRG